MRELIDLKNKCLTCRDCPIGCSVVEGYRVNVFSNMNPDADVMVVGQTPGTDETIEAEPFVGKSGQLFDELVKEVCGLERSDLYLTNLVKCMTPDNRKPYRNEIENCQDYLDKEILLVKPKVIVALGSMAFKRLTGTSGIMKHHGEFRWSVKYEVNVLPLLHPSPYNMNNSERRAMFIEGLKKLDALLRFPDSVKVVGG